MPTTEKSQLAAETRRFRPHERLLVDVIRRQAGTLSKAIAEGVMNSADSILSGKVKNGYCRVKIDNAKVVIEDNGKGFRSKKEVVEWFEVFGQPHDESEEKTFGTFRMGRGQMFAFGKNVWRSGKMQMTVDVLKDGLDYRLETDLENRSGCVVEIDLSSELSDYDRNSTVRELSKWFKYSPVPITVNGEVVTVDPAAEKWDHVTDDAYVRLRRDARDLAVYNLGVFVRDVYGHTFGCGGEVVSRKTLTLNFARNDVMSTCPVWGRVKAVIKSQVDKLSLAGRRLTQDQITAVLRRASAGDAVDGLQKLSLIVDCNGRRYTIGEFQTALGKYRNRFSFARAGDSAADRLLQTQSCLVLDRRILDHLGTTEHDFIGKLCDTFSHIGARFGQYVPFAQASSGLEGDTRVVDEAETSETVQVWMNLARRAVSELMGAGRKSTPWEQWRETYEKRCRRLLVGECPTADGWTDGRTYIVLNRVFLERLPFTVQGVTRLGVLIAHELAHDGPTTEEHTHGVEFYEEFEYLCSEGLPQFVSHATRTMFRSVNEVAKRLNRTLKTDADATERARAAFASAAAGLQAMLQGDPAVDSGDPPPSE